MLVKFSFEYGDILFSTWVDVFFKRKFMVSTTITEIFDVDIAGVFLIFVAHLVGISGVGCSFAALAIFVVGGGIISIIIYAIPYLSGDRSDIHVMEYWMANDDFTHVLVKKKIEKSS